jgi:hypothetical protein
VVHQHFEKIQVATVDSMLGGGLGVLCGQLRKIAHCNALFAPDHALLPVFSKSLRYAGKIITMLTVQRWV